MNVQVVFDALRESANRLKADAPDVLSVIKDLEDDVARMTIDLANPMWNRDETLKAIQEAVVGRKAHVLARVEALAGIEAKKLFAESLDFGLTILFKVLTHI